MGDVLMGCFSILVIIIALLIGATMIFRGCESAWDSVKDVEIPLPTGLISDGDEDIDRQDSDLSPFWQGYRAAKEGKPFDPFGKGK